MNDLTAFQRDILFCIAGGDAPHGIAIQRMLEHYYAFDVHHGRLYPNLDKLVDRGYISKGEKDRRTNEYRLTPRGWEAVWRRLNWEEDRMGLMKTQNEYTRANGTVHTRPAIEAGEPADDTTDKARDTSPIEATATVPASKESSTDGGFDAGN